MYAVIISGGKQYPVKAGETLRVESLAAEVGETVEFEQVLLVANGDDIRIGAPYVAGSKVSAKVVAHGRGEKIRIVKHRRRKHYHKEMGHRQNYTEVAIEAIS